MRIYTNKINASKTLFLSPLPIDDSCFLALYLVPPVLEHNHLPALVWRFVGQELLLVGGSLPVGDDEARALLEEDVHPRVVVHDRDRAEKNRLPRAPAVLTVT